MFPVLDLASLKLAWLKIQADNFVLYGFMLYSDSDEPLVAYVKRAFAEVEYLAPECVIFVIEAPSDEWIQMARRKNHPWLRVGLPSGGSDSAPHHSPSTQQSRTSGHVDLTDDISEALLARLLPILLHNLELCAFQVSPDSTVNARHLLEPDYRLPYNRGEIWEVARYFGIKPDEVPCLILFSHLESGDIWKLNLTEIESVHQAAIYFRRAFESEYFKRILSDARTFRHSATG